MAGINSYTLNTRIMELRNRLHGAFNGINARQDLPRHWMWVRVESLIQGKTPDEMAFMDTDEEFDRLERLAQKI